MEILEHSVLGEIVGPDLIVFFEQVSFAVEFVVGFHPLGRTPRTGEKFDRLRADVFRPIYVRNLV
jgi:hypothetical protein